MRTVQGMIEHFDSTSCDDLPLAQRKSLHMALTTGLAGGMLICSQAVHESMVDGEFQREVLEKLGRLDAKMDMLAGNGQPYVEPFAGIVNPASGTWKVTSRHHTGEDGGAN